MDIYDVIKGRRSVRNYQDRPVPGDVVQELLECAVYAPNGSNRQPWRFALVEDRELLKKWSGEAKSYLLTLLPKLPGMQQYKAVMENESFNIFYNAPLLVMIYGDTGAATYVNDCSMAALNLMLAGYAKGLGSCWIGFFVGLGNQPEFKASLGVPENYQLVAPIVLGFPKGTWPAPSRNPVEILFKK